MPPVELFLRAALEEGHTRLVTDGSCWWFASPDSAWDFPVEIYSLKSDGILLMLGAALEEDVLFQNAWAGRAALAGEASNGE